MIYPCTFIADIAWYVNGLISADVLRVALGVVVAVASIPLWWLASRRPYLAELMATRWLAACGPVLSVPIIAPSPTTYAASLVFLGVVTSRVIWRAHHVDRTMAPVDLGVLRDIEQLPEFCVWCVHGPAFDTVAHSSGRILVDYFDEPAPHIYEPRPLTDWPDDGQRDAGIMKAARTRGSYAWVSGEELAWYSIAQWLPPCDYAPERVVIVSIRAKAAENAGALRGYRQALDLAAHLDESTPDGGQRVT